MDAGPLYIESGGMTMNDFNQEYFFLLPSGDESLPELTPDKDTSTKEYSYKVQAIGMKPLIFRNGLLDLQVERNIVPIDPPPEVMFDGSNLVVCNEIAEKLRDFEIPKLAIQSAIYIDHNKKWHENYWFLTFTFKFDCWDRKNSTYAARPLDTEPPSYEVYTYSLNERLLRDIHLPARRLFKMGGTTDGFVVAHESLADLFRVPGVDVVPIGDYGVSYP
jgi:hypothetical protein